MVAPKVPPKSKHAKPASKPVFRPVLSSPFSLEWPKNSFETGAQTEEWLSQMPESSLDGAIIGINQCSRALEQRVSSSRDHATDVDHTRSDGAQTAVVLICRHDVDPPTLVSHLLSQVTALNAIRTSRRLSPWPLCVLPEGSESYLARKFSVKTCAVAIVFLSSEFWPPIHGGNPSNWLQAAASVTLSSHNSASVVNAATTTTKPRVKLLQSSAPLDLNSVKAGKKKKRQARRQRLQKVSQ